MAIVSRAVWKYGPLNPGDPLTVDMPAATIVAFAEVHAKEESELGVFRSVRLYVWAEVTPDAPKVGRKHVVVGTGWDIEPGWVHRGTVVSTTGYVWHLYENPS